MRLLFLSGCRGAGCSTLCSLFRKRGVPVIEEEVIIPKIIQQNTTLHTKLHRAFPSFTLSESIIEQVRDIERSDLQERKRLHAILDMQLTQECLKLLLESFLNGSMLVVIDVPRLSSSCWTFINAMFTTVVIHANTDTVLRRLMLKGISRDKAALIANNGYGTVNSVSGFNGAKVVSDVIMMPADSRPSLAATVNLCNPDRLIETDRLDLVALDDRIGHLIEKYRPRMPYLLMLVVTLVCFALYSIFVLFLDSLETALAPSTTLPRRVTHTLE